MNRNRFKRLQFTFKGGGGVVYNPRALAWFAEYAVQTGTPFPDAYKPVYSTLFDNLEGIGTTGANNCFDAYKIIKGSPGYFDGSNKWPLLSDFVTPTAAPMTEISGGGDYVQIGTDPNVYTRRATAFKAWNLKVIPSDLSYISLNSAAYGSWLLSNIGSNGLYLLGVANAAGTAEISFQANFSGTQSAMAIHDATYFVATNGGTKGYFEMHRTAASGAGCVEAFKNNVSIGTGNVTSVAVPLNREMICCGFSNDNGATISQTASGGVTPDDGLCTVVDRSAWTTGIGQQFVDSFNIFYTTLGFTP